MIITHEKPAHWVDTAEDDLIQPSEVAGLVHVLTLEPGDLLQGPQGVKGDTGLQGPQGIKGDTGLTGAQGVAPAGAVLHFAMAVAPSGWKICNGAAVSRVTYAALFAALGTLYGAGDGSTTFNLPDLRGEFVRGADSGRGVDVGRVLGSSQGGQNELHSHEIGSGTGSKLRSSAPGGTGGGDGAIFLFGNSGSQYIYPMYVWDSGGGEARPRNVALLPCISTGGVA